MIAAPCSDRDHLPLGCLMSDFKISSYASNKGACQVQHKGWVYNVQWKSNLSNTNYVNSGSMIAV